MVESGKKLGIGILGAAAIAHKNVQAIGKTTNGVEVVAVGSRTLSKAEAFIKEVGLEGKAKAYGSYEAVLEADDVDAVYIPLPTAIHLEWVQKAAAKKKHILLEKPIALTVEDTNGIMKACEEAGIQFMDGTMFVHNPRTAAMHKTVTDAKQLGGVRNVTATFTWRANEDFLANDVRTRKDGDALGAYGDIGWYCIRAALWAYQYEKPSLVQAHAGPQMNRNGVVMHGGGTILWSDGRRLTFDCGFDAVHSMYLQISGADGMVELTDFCIPYDPKQCSYTVKGGAVWHDHDTWIEQPIEERKVTLDRPQETFMWETFAGLVYKIKAGGKPDASWLAQSALCNKLCVAVEQSAQQGGKPVELSKWF